MMRILHFCPLPLYSGLEQYALMLASRQKQRGLDVEFVVQKGSLLEKECAKAGVKFHVVDVYEASVLTAAKRYCDLLAGLPAFDVFHLHTSQDIKRLFFANQLLKWKASWKKPKIIQQNHIWISHGKRDPLHWMVHRFVDELWCSSTPAKKDILRFLPIPEKKVHVIRYGRDLGVMDSFLSREEARAELKLPLDATVIGAIARIDRAKGVWELLNASLHHLNAGADFHLVIIGGPTLSDPAAVAFAQTVDSFVKELDPKLAERIHLTGGIPDAARLLKAFDVYAQGSYKETFSLALLDAQLAELPVIGTESGGTPEVVKEGQTGWLARPESVESMIETFARALNDRKIWVSFGRTARARVEKEFEFEQVLGEIIERYKSSKVPSV